MIEEHLHVRSGAGVRPLAPRNCGAGAKRVTRNAQHGDSCVPVDLKFAHEVFERNTVGKPVEQLLHGQPAAPEARNAAHPSRVDPNRLFKCHRPIRSRIGQGRLLEAPAVMPSQGSISANYSRCASTESRMRYVANLTMWRSRPEGRICTMADDEFTT